jgi:DNA-binding NarL/FixJ family response regulator
MTHRGGRGPATEGTERTTEIRSGGTPSAVLADAEWVHEDRRADIHGRREANSMLTRVAVIDPLPVFRRGVEAILAHPGTAIEHPADALAWVREPQSRIALLTVRTPADWALLADLGAAGTGAVVIAVLDDPTTAAYLRAFHAGAASAVPRDAEPDALRAVFDAVANGRSLVPTDVLRALATEAQDGPRPDASRTPTRQEMEWLRHLSRGVSVSRLASQVGYSERMMFRLLRDLYTRLGVGNRTEALIRARDEGWL